MTLSPPKIPEPPPLPTKVEQGSASRWPTRVLRNLGLAVLVLLVYPAISLSYSWLTKAPAASSASGLSYRMDLAHAGMSELLLIPGFGETLATRWLQERDTLLKNHPDPLTAIENMRGIGPQKLKVIREYALLPVKTSDSPSKSQPISP